MCSLEMLDEARFLENLENLAKCGMSGADVNNDKTWLLSHTLTLSYTT